MPLLEAADRRRVRRHQRIGHGEPTARDQRQLIRLGVVGRHPRRAVNNAGPAQIGPGDDGRICRQRAQKDRRVRLVASDAAGLAGLVGSDIRCPHLGQIECAVRVGDAAG